MGMHCTEGTPRPLGATWDGTGVNFALYSAHATGVDLCLFASPDDGHEYRRIPMYGPTQCTWHVRVEGLSPGQLYGFRVHGAYDPQRGYRFNPNKLLLDPYARAIGRPPRWDESLFDFIPGGNSEQLQRSHTDSAATAPLGLVIDGFFDWGDDRPLRIPWSETIIYEVHVKGFTQRHPDVPEPLRGTYAGLASDAVLAHLHHIGVTSVELLPVHQHTLDRHLAARGLVNYWGYNTLAYFAPDLRYACDARHAVREFKEMVRRFHRAGIEVILDVVYNHTGEGEHLGPSLSLRGIDNLTYYRLRPDAPLHYVDYTGCGNTLDTRNPVVRALILDSLRYWVSEMHVDGFRFDLAAALFRSDPVFDREHPLFEEIRADPILSQVKLIAEPWDLGPDGFRLGAFPPPWREWNVLYRNCARRFWRGDGGQLGEIATRVTGSSDVFHAAGRGPTASINYIASHDGFTLLDLVTYERKHNEANREDNRDGENENFSSNWGQEGPTEDRHIAETRMRRIRALLTTLFLSNGVPMLAAGDELGRTQRGNNNAYCIDSELNWIDWARGEQWSPLTGFVRALVRLRANHRVFRREEFLAGHPAEHHELADAFWFAPNGRAMTPAHWEDPSARAVALLLNGHNLGDDSFLLLFNASHEPVAFRLPRLSRAERWTCVLYSAHRHPETDVELTTMTVASGSIAVLQAHVSRTHC